MNKLIIPPFFVVISLLLIVGFCFLLKSCNVIPIPFNFIGILLVFSGFALMGKARELFKKHQTTLYIRKSTSMITEGVFSKSRNPMYLGMFLMLLGVSVCFRNLYSMLVPFFFLICIRLLFIPKEEKMMFEVFGKEYQDYKARVRRFI